MPGFKVSMEVAESRGPAASPATPSSDVGPPFPSLYKERKAAGVFVGLGLRKVVLAATERCGWRQGWRQGSGSPSAPYVQDLPRVVGDPPLSPLCQPLTGRHPISHGLGPAAVQAEQGGPGVQSPR